MVGVVAALALLGCGSKTGLFAPDAEAPFDASIDGPLDAFVPPDRFVPPDAFVPPDVCVELPPMEPPRSVDVSFVSRVLSAEVYFLVDVTGSMGEEIGEIRARLRDTIIPGIAGQIPDVRFSVARYADFPVDPYGSDGRTSGMPADDLYRLEQRSTTDIDAVQRALDRLERQGGGDLPEATVEALWVTATSDAPMRLVPARSCPAGTVGYPCFEREGSRIFLLFTDAPTHNGPGGSDRYAPVLGFRNHTYEETVMELRTIGAKVLGLYSGDGTDIGLPQLQNLARDTGAVRPDGTPIVFDIGTNGASLGSDVVEAVRTLVEEVPIDVDALTEDWPGDAADATEFVTEIVAASADPASGATRLPDRFVDVRPGTRVTFSIMLANERFVRMEEPQVFRMIVVLRGDGVTRLSETIVDIVVPAIDGDGCDELGR
ncbi:internalin [Sandaracinus amylolyticus]|uniref:Internalin n=1 Tax=Sandaracinus amylolyticus TaxID=927083 RepID=A0A0F6W7A7_9BACT|nr:internalin [Sandaracinus amylolyticus]